MRRTIFSLVFVAMLPALATAGSSSCVDPDDGGCFPTIQAAVDAAPVSGTIEVRARSDGSPYNETVVINTAGLTIEGETPPPFTITDIDDLLAVDWVVERGSCPAIAVDACETAALGEACGYYSHPTATDDQRSAFVVNAPNVTIRHLTIRHALNAVQFNGGADGGTVELNCFINDRRAVMAGSSGGPRVDDITAQRNRLFGINSQDISDLAVTVYGDGSLVVLNLLRLSEGIRVNGNNNAVQLNAVHATGEKAGIQAEHGSNPLVSQNWVEGTQRSAIIVFAMNNGTVGGNVVNDIPDDAFGISIESSSLITVESNTVRATSNPGISIRSTSDNNVVQGNIVDSIGSDTSDGCIEVSESSSNDVTNNTLTLCSIRGISVRTTGANTLSGNHSSWNGTSGVHVEDSTAVTVHNNTLSNNTGEGFSQAANTTGTTVTDNTAMGNRTDICNNGTIATFTGNVFVTGGDTTPCIVEPGL